MNERIESAVNAAVQAFWAEVAAAFPEIRSGDLSPGTTMKFEESCRTTITEWFQGNRVHQPFTEQQLNNLNIRISEHPDQPGRWCWHDELDDDGGDGAFDTKGKAIDAASDAVRETGGLNQCDNCALIWRDDQLKPVSDLEMRVSPGGEMPAGECPSCGCLCYPMEQ